jgi:HEAT repeat protein
VNRIYLTDAGLTDGMFELGGRCLGGAIAWALGEIGDKRAVPALIKVLSERTGNKTYKLEVIKALAKINDIQAEDVLIKLIQDNFGDDIVKAQAAKTLGMLGSTKAVDALITCLAKSNPKPSSKKRLYNPACLGCCAAEALGNIGGERALNELINWQMSTYEHPYAIVTALGKIPDKRAIGALNRTLHIAENDNDIDLQNLVKEIIQKIATN